MLVIMILRKIGNAIIITVSGLVEISGIPDNAALDRSLDRISRIPEFFIKSQALKKFVKIPEIFPTLMSGQCALIPAKPTAYVAV